MSTFFITGTDTGVGKTLISCALLLHAKQLHMQTIALKPVASGAMMQKGRLINDDATLLKSCSTRTLAYDMLNPYVFAEPIAPHIAAQKNQTNLNVHQLCAHAQRVLSIHHDLLVCEGAGGWHVPLNDEENLSDFVRKMAFPVILVVGLRLGCLNHALLTYEAILAAGLNLAGWVANQIDPHMQLYAENTNTLKKKIDAPCLGFLPFFPNPQPDKMLEFLDFLELQIQKNSP